MSWTDYDSPNHLDIMFFIVIWTFITVEYLNWRLRR